MSEFYKSVSQCLKMYLNVSKCAKLRHFWQNLTTFVKVAEIKPDTEMIARNRQLRHFDKYGHFGETVLKCLKCPKNSVLRQVLTLRLGRGFAQKVTKSLNVYKCLNVSQMS